MTMFLLQKNSDLSFVYSAKITLERSAWLCGKMALGYSYVEDTYHDQKNCIPVGSLEFVREYCETYNIHLPDIQYPSDLFPQVKLHVGHVDSLVPKRFPFFTKTQKVKAMDGCVIESPSELKTYKAMLREKEEEIENFYVNYDIYNFSLEVRVFILDGKILNCSLYRGEADRFLMESGKLFIAIESAIAKMPKDICAYSLDFGLDQYGAWRPIEINDFYSLGIYGCDPNDYLKAYKKRWFQIIKENNNENN